MSRRSGSTIARLETYKSPSGKTEETLNRLILPAQGVTASFKVLLFPHRAGETLPVTTGSKDGKTMTVEWPDQKDVVDFRNEPDGRTRLQLQHNGKVVADLQ